MDDKAMLVLSRKSGESIHIGDGIVVTITEIRGGRVKVGISAPDSCVIRRGELQDWHDQPAPVAAETSRTLAANQLAANARRSTVRSTDEVKIGGTRPAADSRLIAERQLAANRVRLAMDLPISQNAIR
jgi:carbon storage regulator